MVYAVHIHRSSDWFDSEHLPITRAEWGAYSLSQDDLAPDAEGVVRWTGHPEGDEVVLDWTDGRVTAYQPDEATLERLAVIATALGAVLQGDDCEIYGGDGTLLEQKPPAAPARREPDSDDGRPRLNAPTSRADFLRGLLRRP